MNRTEAIQTVISSLGKKDIALFTTGMISRDAFSLGDREGNFYMLGSMGLLSAFALGIALNSPYKVVIVEGDGSALLSLGTFALIGSQKPENLHHIVIDNEAYESTGGQPTITNIIDLAEIASACSYRTVKKVEHLTDLVTALPKVLNSVGPSLLLIKVALSDRKPARVTLSPVEIKERVEGFLRGV